MIKVGDKLYGEAQPRFGQYVDIDWTVASIGRKIIVTDRGKVTLADLKTVSNMSPIQMYLTEQERNDVKERRELLKAVNIFDMHRLTLQQLRDIHNIITATT